MWNIVFIFILLGLGPKTWASPAPAFRLQNAMDGTPLGPSMEYLVDAERQYDEATIADAPDAGWKPLLLPFRNFGHLHAPVWLRFLVENAGDHPSTVYFENNYALTDRMTWVQPESLGGRVQTLGDMMPLSEREIRYYHPVFVNLIPRGTHRIFVKIDTSDLVTVALKVWDPTSFNNMMIQKSMAVGLLFGIMVALLCYNIILFFSTRLALLKSYCSYLVCFILTQFCLIGIAQIAVPDPALSLWLSNSGFRLILTMTIYSALAFMRHFLNLQALRTRLDQITRIFMMALLGLLVYQLADGPGANILSSAALAICASHFLICATIVVRDGYRPARILLFAWTLILTGTCVTSSADLGLLNIDMGDVLLWHLATGCVEMILLSLAIGEWWREERQRRQQEATQYETVRVAIQARQDHAFDQLKKIIYPHQLERIMDGQQLEQTMPVGKGLAAVIAFDIVASSRVDHDTIQEFLRQLFAQCHVSMMKNYQPLRLQANAYRIKETGDGFLCSIGYPFKVSDGRDVADVAVRLAQEFVQLFQAGLEDFPVLRHLTCCCGIALDRVESFFPKQGVQVYDLYGRAIVLATRYEALRKEIKSFTPEASYIILQERVYQSLPAGMRTAFEPLNLVALRIKVRDDVEAATCYFQKITKPEHEDRLPDPPLPASF